MSPDAQIRAAFWRSNLKATAYGLAVLLAANQLAASTAFVAGDATRGEQVFAGCAACHSIEAGTNMFGPSLFAIVDRPSASLDDYNYSPALQALKITWTAVNIDKFISNPTAMAPGTKMPFKLTNPKDRADVIAYLATLN
jgi:cytochrome c